jgi:HSP20 family molecular chaperone IbpA
MTPLRDTLRSLPRPVNADLRESPSAYQLVLDLPGATARTVEASVAGSHLHIEATREKDVPGAFTYVDEDRDLFLDVDLPLPPDATGAGAEGSVERGVLRLTLPKRSAAPAATIPIGGSEAG